MEATVRKGVTMDPQSGNANVPEGEGVRHEVRDDGTVQILAGDTPASRRLIEELIRLNGLEAEAAKARGNAYIPTMGERVRSVATSNVTPLKLVAFVVVGGATIWLGRKALRWLSGKMGWTLFVGVSEIDERDGRAGQNRAPRRVPSAPTQPSASA